MASNDRRAAKDFFAHLLVGVLPALFALGWYLLFSMGCAEVDDFEGEFCRFRQSLVLTWIEIAAGVYFMQGVGFLLIFAWSMAGVSFVGALVAWVVRLFN